MEIKTLHKHLSANRFFKRFLIFFVKNKAFDYSKYFNQNQEELPETHYGEIIKFKYSDLINSTLLKN